MKGLPIRLLDTLRKANEGKFEVAASKADFYALVAHELAYPFEAFINRLQEMGETKLPYDRLESCLPISSRAMESEFEVENLPLSQNAAVAIPAVESRSVVKTRTHVASKAPLSGRVEPQSRVLDVRRAKPINKTLRSREFEQDFEYLPEKAQQKIREIEDDIRHGRFTNKRINGKTFIYDLPALNLGHRRGIWRLYVRQLSNQTFMSDYIVDYHGTIPKRWQPQR